LNRDLPDLKDYVEIPDLLIIVLHSKCATPAGRQATATAQSFSADLKNILQNFLPIYPLRELEGY